MKKAVKSDTLTQSAHIVGQLWRIFTKLINIARLYTRIQVRRFFLNEGYEGINQTINAIKLPKDGKNLKFTLIEKVAGMTIFHGTSKNTVDEEDLVWIEKNCTKNRPGAYATVSNENDDPHLFKIVLWNENPA